MFSGNSLDIAKFGARFTQVIIFWNHCELCAKQILQLLMGHPKDEDPVAMAVATQLQARSLIQVSKAIARKKDHRSIQPHIDHFFTGFQRLSDYRHYYVHGMMGIDKGNGGLLSLRIRNGVLQFCSDTVSPEMLSKVADNMGALVGYGAAIQKELGASGCGIEALLASYESKLDMPKWLVPIEKAAFDVKVE